MERRTTTQDLPTTIAVELDASRCMVTCHVRNNDLRESMAAAHALCAELIRLIDMKNCAWPYVHESLHAMVIIEASDEVTARKAAELVTTHIGK